MTTIKVDTYPEQESWYKAQYDLYRAGETAKDTKIKLQKVMNVLHDRWFSFYLSTDDYFLFDSARLALEKHGSLSSQINGKEFSNYHRSQGYRLYMVWGSLPLSADTTRFLHEVLNRRNETLIDSNNNVVGIVEKGLE